MASRAIPAHLKPSAAEGKGDGFNSQRHHGKSQSHVVSHFLPCSLVAADLRLFCKAGH
jgi:UTP--glucose-1-phosphate uridylyltransferase